jgi:Na+-driven multidrug efflux pump
LDRSTYFKDFRRTGGLTQRKLKEYIPTMIMTNLSVLLVSIDGLVVGNFDGMDALSSVNIFYPVSLITGTLSVMAGVGISTSLSTAMGENDFEKLDYLRGLSLRIIIIMAACVAILQIPVVLLISIHTDWMQRCMLLPGSMPSV